LKFFSSPSSNFFPLAFCLVISTVYVFRSRSGDESSWSEYLSDDSGAGDEGFGVSPAPASAAQGSVVSAGAAPTIRTNAAQRRPAGKGRWSKEEVKTG